MPPGTTTPESFPVAAFEPLAHRLANRLQRREADHMDLVQEGQLRLLETCRQKEEDGEEIDQPGAFARHVMRSAMLDYYGYAGSKPAALRKETDLEADCPEGALPTVPVDDPERGRVLVREFLSDAEDSLPAVAALILRELARPSNDVVALADESREHECRVRYSHIRRAHDIYHSAFWNNLSRLREFAREWWGT